MMHSTVQRPRASAPTGTCWLVETVRKSAEAQRARHHKGTASHNTAQSTATHADVVDALHDTEDV
jgi:hypothetical protein